MYNKFFGLSEYPFPLTSDATFFYPSRQHSELLKNLVSALQKGVGLVSLTGEPGTGKTTTLACLCDHLNAQGIKFISLSYPRANVQEFFETIGLDLGLPRGRRSRSEGLDALDRMILREAKKKRRVVFIFDEAHLLQHTVLDEIGRLGSLGNNVRKPLQIVLAGQPKLVRELDAPDLNAIRERIALHLCLHRFTGRDTAEYIRFRLERAAMPDQRVFSRSLIADVHLYSGGIPRLINTICDSLLMAAFADSSKVCSGEMLRSVCADMGLELPAGISEPAHANESAAPIISRAVVTNGDFLSALPRSSDLRKPNSSWSSWPRVISASFWAHAMDLWRVARMHPLRTGSALLLLPLGLALAPSLHSLPGMIQDRAAITLGDDFRAGLNDWRSARNASTAWSFDQAGFVRPAQLALYQPTINLSDYEVQFLGTIDKKAMGWVVRAADFDNYYVVKLVIDKQGPLPTLGVTRYAVVAGRSRRGTHIIAPVDSRADTLYHVRLNIHGDDFTLAVQDRLVDAWSEPSSRHGGIGFFSERGEASSIRWVRVTHQSDLLGRLCQSLALFVIPPTNGNHLR
jgi:general secretion pathway protein A